MLNPTGLIRGHYECRSFDQTLPILSDLLALESCRREQQRKDSQTSEYGLAVCHSRKRTRRAHQTDAKSLRCAGDEQRRSRSRHRISGTEERRIRYQDHQTEGKPQRLFSSFLRNGGNYWEI